MEYELFTAFISEKSYVLIPTIYLIGLFLKSLEAISDKYIPILLLCIGIVLSVAINGLGVDSFIQAVLCSSIAVFFNQTFKQLINK